MKKAIIAFTAFLIVLVIGAGILLKGMTIINPKMKNCTKQSMYVTKIEASSSMDIFLSGSNGKSYYINRGIERGLTVKELSQKVLHKEISVYLPKLLTGISNHISQLSIGDEILFTEFEE